MSQYQAVKEDYRQLASIVTVDSILPHPNADRLELAIIGGWQCVVKKGEFTSGQTAIYVEIDALVPLHNPLFAFLAERKDNLKTFDGVDYSRICTIKLRKELSQGLLVPVPLKYSKHPVGTNLTHDLEVMKYDKISEAANTDVVHGALNSPKHKDTWFGKLCAWIAGPEPQSQMLGWPSYLTKSEQPRAQNCSQQINAAVAANEEFEATYKLHGESITIYNREDHVPEVGLFYDHGVCSRNNRLYLHDIHFTWLMATRRWLALFLLINARIPRVLKFAVVEWLESRKIDKAAAWEQLRSYSFPVIPKFVRVIRAMDNHFIATTAESGLWDRLREHYELTDETLALQGEICGPGIQQNFEGLDEKRIFIYTVYRNGDKLLPTEARSICERLGVPYIPVLNKSMQLPGSSKACVIAAEGPSAFGGKFREGLVFKSLTRHFSFKAVSAQFLLKEEEAEKAA